MRTYGSAGQRTTDRTAAASAFTLLELLVVLVILGIVVAILLPALSGVRNSARKAATLALVKDVSAAAGSFQTDNRRQPGYFAPRELGSRFNQNRGFTAMENVMLDLAGGIVPDGTTGPNVIRVGPNGSSPVTVDLDLIGAPSGTKSAGGASTGGYFVPDRSLFLPQDGTDQKAANNDHKRLPNLIDPFGNPILAWAPDDAAPPDAAFASLVAGLGGGGSGGAAKFYWSSNAAFLKARALGRAGRNQTFSNADVPHSLIGKDVPPDRIVASMEGLLGNPAYPVDATQNPKHPSVARGSIIFHSAGPDGYYLGSEDRGGKIAGGAGGIVRYDTTDAMGDFDDVLFWTN